MIARIWTTRVVEGRLDAYVKFARDISMPMFRSASGCKGVLMYSQNHDCSVLTLWESRAHIDAFQDSQTYKATVKSILDRGFLEGEQNLVASDVQIGWIESLLVSVEPGSSSNSP